MKSKRIKVVIDILNGPDMAETYEFKVLQVPKKGDFLVLPDLHDIYTVHAVIWAMSHDFVTLKLKL